VSAWNALVRTMDSENVSWNDLGNWIEHGSAECNDGKYTEAELQEFGQALRAEGVEAGIKIGLARAGNGAANSHLTLPKPAEMAQYCHERLRRFKNDRERDFISDVYLITQRGRALYLGQLGYLASLYIQIGGKT
jgi:hypothetical protein